jgi:hypothetical protein
MDILLINLLTLKDYLVAVVSATGATAVSALTVVSAATAVESVLTSVEALPPQATNDVAIATIAITFFIFCLF